MKKGLSNCVELHDAPIHTVDTFVYWLHTHVILLEDGSDMMTDDNIDSVVNLYLFADIYDTLCAMRF